MGPPEIVLFRVGFDHFLPLSLKVMLKLLNLTNPTVTGSLLSLCHGEQKQRAPLFCIDLFYSLLLSLS